MEPPMKRQRLSAPERDDCSLAYEESDEYYEPSNDGNTSLDIDPSQEYYEIEGQSEDEEDRDIELRQKRAVVHNKLKSRFEAIFEKYGKDFTGIGDEIDLRTGEIVVNNGHLIDMQDERDAGSNKRLSGAFTQEPKDSIATMDGELKGLQDTDRDENSGGHDGFGHTTSGDMDENMGLYQNGTAISQSQNSLSSGPFASAVGQEHQESQIIQIAQKSYPSEEAILAQFGPQLGPKISRYVSQQRVLDNANIDPLWRVPGPPPVALAKRPLLKSMLLEPTEMRVTSGKAPEAWPTSKPVLESLDESDRSPSPEGSSSIWAVKMPPGRPRKDGADVAAIFKGEIFLRDGAWYSTKALSKHRAPNVQRQGNTEAPQSSREGSVEDSCEVENATVSEAKPKRRPRADRSPLSGTRHRVILCEESQSPPKPKRHYSQPKQPRKPRQSFTPEEDNLVVEWVEEAQRRGYSLWGWAHWKIFAESNKQHTFLSWLDHYRKHIYPRGVISEVGDGEANKLDRNRRKNESISEPEQDSSVLHSLEPSSGSKSPIGYNVRTASGTFPEEDQPNHLRPLRVRRPSKKDPGKISWEDAVETLEDVDPVLHATLVKDAETAGRCGHSLENATPCTTVFSSPQDTRFPSPSSILDSQDSGSQVDSRSKLDNLTNCRSRDNNLEEQFESNMIDASYTFSDDDGVPPRIPNKVTPTPTSNRQDPTPVDEVTNHNLGLQKKSSSEPCSCDASPMHLAKDSPRVQEAGSTSLQRPETRILPKPRSTFLSQLDNQNTSKHISKPSPCQETGVLPNPKLISEPQPGQDSTSPASKSFVPTHQSTVEVRRPSMRSQSTNKLTVHREDLPTRNVQELPNINQVQAPLTKIPSVPTQAPTRGPDSKPNPLSPKLNSNFVQQPNSASKPTVSKSKSSKSAPSPLSAPVSNPRLQSAALPIYPVPRTGVISRSSPSQNVGLQSKYSTELKTQRLTPAEKPDQWRARISTLLADDDLDELSMGPDDFAKLPTNSSQAKLSSAYQRPKSHIGRLVDKMEGTLSCVSTPKNVARQAELRTGGDSGLDSLLIETSGSMRKCGDSEFKCGRNFCFKCE